MKACKGCGQNLPLNAFQAAPRMRDGLKAKCRTCCTAEHREWIARQDPAQIRSKDRVYRDANRETVRRWGREWRQANAERHAQTRKTYAASHRAEIAERNRRFQEQFPEKARAHKLLNRALASGRIVKPSRCTNCGSGRRLEGHHDDYERALDVRWLCVSCHRLLHGSCQERVS